MTSVERRTIVAAIGCASAATVSEMVALLADCLAEAGVDCGQLIAIGSHTRKAGSLELYGVARHFGVPLRLLDDDDVDARYHGVCEAVAGAAGRLLLGKRKSAFATCALARVAPGFSLLAFGQPASPSAAMASSSETTSWAGP